MSGLHISVSAFLDTILKNLGLLKDMQHFKCHITRILALGLNSVSSSKGASGNIVLILAELRTTYAEHLFAQVYIPQTSVTRCSAPCTKLLSIDFSSFAMTASIPTVRPLPPLTHCFAPASVRSPDNRVGHIALGTTVT